MNGERSPHASYLHPKWGKDAAWMAHIGAAGIASADGGGQVVIEQHAEATTGQEVGQQKPVTVVREKRTRVAKKSAADRVLRPLPCVSLGVVTKYAGSCCPRKNTHRCKLGEGDESGVQPAVQCETCEKYVVDPEAKADADEKAEAMTPPASDR